MKKAIIIMLLALLAVTAVFASSQLSVSISPYSYQSVRQIDNGKKHINSTYGMGGKAVYAFDFDNNFYVDAEVGALTFWAKDKDNCTDVFAVAKGGYTFDITDKFCINAEAGYGLNLMCYEKDCSASGVFDLEVGAEYAINNKLSVLASCEGMLGLSKKDDVHYNNWLINMYIGMGITF